MNMHAFKKFTTLPRSTNAISGETSAERRWLENCSQRRLPSRRKSGIWRLLKRSMIFRSEMRPRRNVRLQSPTILVRCRVSRDKRSRQRPSNTRADSHRISITEDFPFPSLPFRPPNISCLQSALIMEPGYTAASIQPGFLHGELSRLIPHTSRCFAAASWAIFDRDVASRKVSAPRAQCELTSEFHRAENFIDSLPRASCGFAFNQQCGVAFRISHSKNEHRRIAVDSSAVLTTEARMRESTGTLSSGVCGNVKPYR